MSTALTNTVTKQEPPGRYASRQVNPQRLHAIRQHAGQRVLDAGCGNGAYVNLLCDQLDIHGVDIARYEAWRANPERFSVNDVANLEYEDNSFETVTSFEVLEHLPNPEDVLRGFCRIASRNIILTVPNCELPAGLAASRLAFFHYTDPTHVNFFTLDSIRNLCETVGLRVVESRLVNPLNLTPLLGETYALPALAIKALQRCFERRKHYMTCLVVAEER